MSKPLKFATALFVTLCAVTVAAQDYPNRPITLVHGFGAGGNIDTVARIIAPPLAERLGQPVVVESRTGAGGTVAEAYVARAKPDGYTLLMMHGGGTVSPAIYKSLPYTPLEDFTTVAMLTRFPFLFAVRTDSRYKSLADVIQAAKAAPGTITFSSVGVGSTQHLSGELLQSMAGIKLVHVPYRGGGAPLADLIGGQVDILADSLAVAMSAIKSGRARALAITSPKPWETARDIPTVASLVPGYDVRSFHGIGGPKDMPVEIVNRLSREVAAVLQLPEVREKLIQNAGVAVAEPMTPQAMRDELAAQIAKWKKVVAEAGIPQQ